MSKSLDNYIGIAEAPQEMYGKTLSIPDDLIYTYFVLATDSPTEELESLRTFAADDPRNAKHELARTIVRMYHGSEAADAARKHFERTVIKGEIPENINSFKPTPENDATIGILNLMSQAGLTESNGQGRRMIQQRAVEIDGDKISDIGLQIDLATATPFILKVGKRRFARIIWNGR
jgi:tyrosyl-tRNA synthetase